MAYNDFTTLKIWQEAHSLAIEVYTHTHSFPSIERFGLTDQMRRAAVSVAANIAEGTGRKTSNDFAHFLAMARGSVHEMMSHCMLAQDLGLMPRVTSRELSNRYKGLSAGIYRCMDSIKARQQ